VTVKSNLVSKGIAAIGALGVAAGLLVTTASPAPAAAPVIVAVGAHATEDVMAKLFLGTGVYNIPAQPVSPATVPADTISCQTSVTYAQSPISAGQTLAPNGGNLGRDALKQGSPYNTAAPNNGCVSIARSSSGPRKAGTASGQDPSTYQYYAFAMDAVTWASPSLNAPAVLTPAQILGIYNCTYTNWAQVGGGSGPIQRYEPQPGAATRSFFESAFLGGLDPTTISTPSCPAVITTAADGGPLDESVGSELDAVNYQKAILPYDTAEWSFQANNFVNPTIDERSGVIAHGVVATRKASNFTSITDGSTTSGSTTVGSAGSNFSASEVGAPISGTGIPSGDVIQSVAADNSSVVLASSGNTRTITDGATHKTVTQVNTTSGSTTISINGGSSTFSAADVGAKLSIPTSGGNGLQDGSTVASFVDATHVTISAPATQTNNGTSVPANAITLNLNGGSKAVSSATAAFVPGDVGKVISGANLPAAAAVTGVSGDGTTAYISAAATGANSTGNTWVVDDPKATATGSALKLSIGTNATANGSTTLTTTNGLFTAFDVGASVAGAGIAAGTTLTAVSGNTATLSQPANSGLTTAVTLTDLSENGQYWTTDGVWVANITSSLQDPRGPVAESNISQVSGNPAFPGIRYLYNVIDTANPYFPTVQPIVGFDNSIGGSVVSPVCSGSKGSVIGSFGLAKLDTSDPGGTPGLSGPNIVGSHCRFSAPQ
jgi:hypothetical protein